MPASPISKREALQKNFEDYTLTYASGPRFGLYPIASEKMIISPPNAGIEAASTNTNVFDIGFGFPFEDKIYKNVYVCTNGWAILHDPNYAVAHPSSYVFDNPGGTAPPNVSNVEIKDVFTRNHLLLCPWWSDSMNTFSTLERATKLAGSPQLTYISSGSSSWEEGSPARLIRDGIITPESIGKFGYGEKFGGVKYYAGSTSKYGKFFVIRWSSFLGNDVLQDVASYDVVLYENGVVEFRYGKVYNVPAGSSYVATVGIFAYGGSSGNPRYRDFSQELIPAESDTRPRYENGGTTYDGVYTSSTPVGKNGPTGTRKYCISLDSDKNWPGGREYGGVFQFAPPLRRKRQLRTTIRNIDSTTFVSDDSLFDDRSTILFTKQLVEFPSMLPVSSKLSSNSNVQRAYTTLFVSGGIQAEITSAAAFDESIRSNLADYRRRENSGSDAYNEDKQFEVGMHADAFFSKGSSEYLGNEPGDFSQPLDHKTQIKLSFPVNKQVRMLGNTSSIYYFNPLRQQWNIPTNSIGNIVGPFEKYSSRYHDVSAVEDENIGSSFIEDAIGFDAYGFCVASGTQDVVRYNPPQYAKGPSVNQSWNQTSNNLGSLTTFNKSAQVEVMGADYQKNIQRSSDFDATEETFTLPIDYPFLIEKAVFEIPMCMGPRWFNDKTATITSGSAGTDGTLLHAGSLAGTSTNRWRVGTRVIDEGGPAMTLALMCQKNYGTSSIRDLITKSLITHTNDMSGTISLDTGVSGNYTYYSTYYGFDDRRYWQYRLNFSGMPKDIPVDSIVYPDNSGFFTGSVLVKSDSLTTNGVKLWCEYSYSRSMTGATLAEASASAGPYVYSSSGSLSGLLSSQFLTNISGYVKGTDVFGRGFTGFAPSGGSIFGREFGAIDFENITVSNPWYVSSSSERNDLLNSWYTRYLTEQKTESWVGSPPSVSAYAGVKVSTSIILSSSQDSPYLINPGEKLVLAVSKKRPVMNSYKLNIVDPNPGTKGGVSLISSSYYNNVGSPLGHDVMLNTGSINITIYGSYVQGNRGFNL